MNNEADRYELALLTNDVLQIVQQQMKRAETIAQFPDGGKDSARILLSECDKIYRLCQVAAKFIDGKAKS